MQCNWILNSRNFFFWKILNFYLNFSAKFTKFKKLNFYVFFNTSFFIWGFSFHNLEYLDKPIKCLEMRAKIKSVRKINEIFLCIFTYIRKSDIFSTYLNFDEKLIFGYFKSLFIKCPIHMNILSPILYQKCIGL